jgi:signal transduction histidine kinase
MFKEARVKLTAWYLLIIMTISLSFSMAIYAGVDAELMRVYNLQFLKQQRIETFDSETIESARLRIIWTLGIINLSILLISGMGGYLLAGITLEPISKMVREQKEFVGNASHELRTPLTSLKTEIEVGLRNKKLGIGEAKKLLRSNLEEVDNMQRLSNHLLSLNRYEKASDINFLPVKLKEVALEALKRTSVLASAKKIKVKSVLKDIKVKGDKVAFVELASILLENAIKYSPNGSKVEVRVKKGGILEVQDFGMGINKVDMPHIFDRFYRVEHSRSKEKTDGYGLGLSIAKTITDKFDSKLKVSSKIGKGSTFSVQFPNV